MSDLPKQRYLDILSSGVFAKLSPPRLRQLHQEVGAYLKANAERIDGLSLFDLYELQFYLSLLTNHDIEAKSYLDRFNDQFSGQRSQKIMILRLMYLEATGKTKEAVDALGQNHDELRASRRLATFSRTKASGEIDIPDYIKTLNYYLNLQPSDVVTWAELGDQYHLVGHYDKAVFCFKEVLLHTPNSYNIFYKVGLNLYYQHLQELSRKADKKDTLLETMALLEHARDSFLRSVEISESYTKGWVGVYVVGKSELLSKLEKNKTLAGMDKVTRFISDTQKVLELAKLRIMDLERLTDADFEPYLATQE